MQAGPPSCPAPRWRYSDSTCPSVLPDPKPYPREKCSRRSLRTHSRRFSITGLQNDNATGVFGLKSILHLGRLRSEKGEAHATQSAAGQARPEPSVAKLPPTCALQRHSGLCCHCLLTCQVRVGTVLSCFLVCLHCLDPGGKQKI